MRKYAPFIIIALAVLTAFFAVFGENNYERILALRKSLSQQKEKNAELSDKVRVLRQEVYAIQHDDRALEKAARNEFGMARPDEMIFIFEKGKEQDRKKP